MSFYFKSVVSIVLNLISFVQSERKLEVFVSTETVFIRNSDQWAKGVAGQRRMGGLSICLFQKTVMILQDKFFSLHPVYLDLIRIR